MVKLIKYMFSNAFKITMTIVMTFILLWIGYIIFFAVLNTICGCAFDYNNWWK